MKNYLVVGASKGIGLSLTRKLLSEGNNVYVWSRSMTSELEQLNVTYTSNDITSSNIDDTQLPDVLDGLVYCPGSINLKPFHRLTQNDFLSDLQINLIGAIKSIQFTLPMLKKSKSSSILLFSTVAVGSGMTFHASVASAKGAVEGLVKSLSAELAPQIRVNAIAPSLTQTPLAEKLLSTEEKKEAAGKRHPLQRFGQPEDIADMAQFLLSEKSSWITGQIIHVDGGMSAVK
jgi:NAD(P)-dependent dehydrogenase (short-subunit alcohol dehydrogenase family)